MQTRILGKNLQVPALGYGCMGLSFGLQWTRQRPSTSCAVRTTAVSPSSIRQSLRLIRDVQGDRHPASFEALVNR